MTKFNVLTGEEGKFEAPFKRMCINCTFCEEKDGICRCVNFDNITNRKNKIIDLMHENNPDVEIEIDEEDIKVQLPLKNIQGKCKQHTLLSFDPEDFFK